MANTTVGAGVTITFSSGYFARIEDVSYDGPERAFVETTHAGTVGGDTFIPITTYDPGEITVLMQFDSAVAPPITAAAEAVVLNLPPSGSNTITFVGGFLTSFSLANPIKDKVMATAKIKLSGNATFA